jgi:hypothetical protein
MKALLLGSLLLFSYCMRYNELPSQEHLRDLFEYADGHLYWRKQVGRGRVGDVVGHKYTAYKSSKRVMTRINHKAYLVHRLIYKWHNADFDSSQEIDHIDGNPSNNRIENLRLVDHKTNMQNIRRRTDNTSGVAGIVWDKQKDKWMVRVSNKFIGRTDDFDKAVEMRAKALSDHSYHPNHGR